MSRITTFLRVLREYRFHPITYRVVRAYEIAFRGLPF